VKKIIVLCLILVLAFIPFAVGICNAEDSGMSSSNTTGSGNGDQNRDQSQDQLSNQTQIKDQDQVHNQTVDQSQDQLQNRTREINQTELHDQIQEQMQQLDQQQLNLSTNQRVVYLQYNNVSAFVHILQNNSDQFGGIGPQVSQYAMQFNNSIQAEIQIQERIQTRNAIVRFFVGGDEVAAGELEQQVNQTQARIQEFQQLIQQCTCDPQVKELLQEQLQQMQQQQLQIHVLAQNELQDKGLFGWLWK
jgi:hypothetical protein